MKELLRSNDPTIIAFASALLRGEGIDCFEMDVNMSILEGSIGVFPRRLMVRTDDLEAAEVVMKDNDIALGRPG
ncbi:putative signal transducing protein [Shimia sp. W99]